MNGNVILAVLWISMALVPVAIMILDYFGIEPEWLVAIATDRVALAWGTGVTALAFVAVVDRGSWFTLAWVTLGAFLLHVVISQVRLRRLLRRRQRDAAAPDA